MDPVYGYEAVNVEAQSRSLSSLLSWTKRLIAVRKSTQVFGRGTLTFIRPANRAVLVYVRQYRTRSSCASPTCRARRRRPSSICRRGKDRIPLEMLGRTRFPAIGELPYVVTLAPYGFFWFQLQRARQVASQCTPRAVPEFETLVVPVNSTWVSLARDAAACSSATCCRAFSRGRAGFPSKPRKRSSRRLISATAVLRHRRQPALACASSRRRSTAHDALRAAAARSSGRASTASAINPQALAAVRQGAREGTLLDVATDEIFIALLLRNLRAIAGGRGRGTGLRLEFRPTSRFADCTDPAARAHPRGQTEQSNTTALVDNDYVVKLYRQLEAGINPEIEIGRFLTDVAGFANTPPLLGTVELIEGDRRSAIGVVHAFVENQGDAWTVTSAYLDRFVDEQRLLAVGDDADARATSRSPYLRYMAQIGRRARRDAAGARQPRSPPDFAPEPIRPGRRARWTDDAHGARRTRLRRAGRSGATTCGKPTGRWSTSLLAQRDDAARPPARAVAARHRRR